MSGAVAQAQGQETAQPAHYDSDGDGLIEISSLAQLNAVRWDLDGDGVPSEGDEDAYSDAFPVADEGSVCPANTTCNGFELTTDLDFDENGDGEITEADRGYWNDGAGWDPIGSWGFVFPLPFNAVFEGNGHTISHLYINSNRTSPYDGAGLFGLAYSGSSLRNLGLVGVEVTGRYAGGLVGSNHGTIIASYITGSVKADGKYGNVGGLVGTNYGTIIASHATGSVKAGSYGRVGGLVGSNHYGTIINSYFTGSVKGSTTGGLASSNGRGTIIASYVNGSVSGERGSFAGGLVGDARPGEGTISASYFSGSITGGATVGGLVGDKRDGKGTISASYYDSEVSRLKGDTRGKPTAELQETTGYTSIYAEWNLDLDGDGENDDPWDFGTDSQYPALKWDYNGDGTATWQEFGHQVRHPISLSATVTGTQAKLTWNAVMNTHWQDAPSVHYALYRNGKRVTDYDGASLTYTDTDVSLLGGRNVYQVAVLLDGMETVHSNEESVFLEVGRKDSDGDGLIEINDLDQLSAMRYDKDGDGASDRGGDNAVYATAFPAASGGGTCISGSTCKGYELIRDLDFNDAGSYASGSTNMASWAKGNGSGPGWQPITWSDSRGATFEGNGHVISNLYINRTDREGSRAGHFVGLFSSVAGKVQNLQLTGVDVRGYEDVGGLAGSVWSTGAINEVATSGLVSGWRGVGGLVGNNHGTITSSYAIGTVNGTSAIGGLVATNKFGGVIESSYAAGQVDGNRYVGGLVGVNVAYAGGIWASYAVGTVSGDYAVGGLVGGDNRHYGVVNYYGRHPNRIVASYYDSDTSGLKGPHGKTTAELTVPGFRSPSDSPFDQSWSGWDFGTASQYPALKADTNGDNTATWQEFGYQLRRPLPLTASVSGLQATLNWDDITETEWTGTPQVSYALYRGGEKIADYDGSSRSYIDTGVTLGREYTYQVALLLDGAEVRRSNEASVTPISKPLSFGDGRLYDYHWHQNQNNGRLDLPAATGGVAPLTYAVSPDLPDGLVFDAEALTITGAPTAAQDRVHYAYTVTDATGDTAALPFSILIEADPEAPLPVDPEVAADRAALVALYEATDGPNWTNNANWHSDQPLDQWHGVTTDGDDRVTGLMLRDNNLDGPLPAALGGLERLEALSLDGNKLSGAIPSELGSLGSLTRLALNRNSLDGPIPDGLRNLSSLSILGLARNAGLTGGVSWLGDLSSLTRVSLHDTGISGSLPAELGDLYSLQRLAVQNTGLSGPLPHSLTELSALEQLYVEGTDLCAPQDSGFQAWLGGVGEKDSGRACTDRDALVALYDATSGAAWTNSGNWKSDEPLAEWQGVTTDDDGRVTSLILRDNGLSGELPALLGGMDRLEVLSLDRNSLNGELPAQLGNLSSLTRLSLNRNQLSGSIPSELGSLSNLSIIGLANNQLSGSLPTSLGNLSGLTRLSLHDNTGLSGALPSGFTGMVDLQRLAIANTGLCAPDDEAFRNWLDTVPDKPGGVETCE